MSRFRCPSPSLNLMTAWTVVLLLCAFCASAHAGGDAAERQAHVKTISVHGMDFPVLDIGSGPAVLLVHGFPDSHELWRKQVDPLVKAGFRVIAPDLRGFGDAPRPPAVADYAISKVLGDLVGILDALEIKQARVVGHDWGAAISWALAMYYPNRVERLMVLSVGAPGNPAFDSIEQREKSWYTLFFQFDGVAEAELQKNNWALMRSLMRNEGDIDAAIQRFERPGALTAALNYYRANWKPQVRPASAAPGPKVTCNVLGVWSDNDHYLGEAQMLASAPYVSGTWRYEKLHGAGHWMMLEQPDAVNRLLLDFLR